MVLLVSNLQKLAASHPGVESVINIRNKIRLHRHRHHLSQRGGVGPRQMLSHNIVPITSHPDLESVIDMCLHKIV